VAVTTVIAGSVMAVFVSLSFIHIYWLCGGRVGRLVAIPEMDGKPIFKPSPVATLVVAIGQALCAMVIAGDNWDTRTASVTDVDGLG